MIKFKIAFFLIWITLGVSAQETVIELFNLPKKVNETSGLLYLNGNIITHNDSGGKAELYQLDSETGEILRTVVIANAKNKDWEELTQDDTHIYVGDFGNNYGARKDFKIYKILKDEFFKKDTVNAVKIHFSLSDQTQFIRSNSNNFDIEAMIALNDKLYLFSKNRRDKQTKLYELSSDKGTHIAKYLHTLPVDGLITGASVNTYDNSILLSGYADGLSPFLVYLKTIDATDFVRIDLAPIIGLGNQIEGISFIENQSYYLSREKVNKKVGGFSIKIPAKLFKVDVSDYITATKSIEPYINFIKGDSEQTEFNFKKVKITNQSNKILFKRKDSLNLIKPNLDRGLYRINIKVSDTLSVNKLVEF